MPKRILVADDDATTIRLMQKYLEERGHEVILARDGDVALEKIPKEKPDLIILDIEMPRVNGYVVINELMKMPEFASIPLIILTSHQEMQPIFERKGVIAYLSKPVNFTVLFEKIDSVI